MSDVLVLVKECDLCRQVLRVVTDPESGREVAFDQPSGEEHECWDIPPGAEVLVAGDGSDCNCGP